MQTNSKPKLNDSTQNKVYVVIAAYNESATIGDVVAELIQTYPNVVVVDDGSIDDTRTIAHLSGATVLRHVINRGQGAALQTGITHSLSRGAEIIVTFDADGQHSVDDLPSMLEPILSGRAQIVLGSRFLEDSGSVPLGRRLLLGGGVLFMRLTSRVRLTDAHNGFRAFSRRAAQQIDIQLDRMAHASELIDQIRRSGLPFQEVPVHIQYNEYTLAKGQGPGNAVRVAADYLFDKLLR